MEITKEWYQKEVLKILRVSRKMREVLDDPAKQDHPDCPKAADKELHFGVHCGRDMPKQS